MGAAVKQSNHTRSFWGRYPADAELRRLCAAGLPASQIADALSVMFGETITKNAVIGRLHRLKLSNRQHRTGSPADKAARERNRRAPIEKKKKPLLPWQHSTELNREAPYVPDEDVSIIPLKQRCSIYDLTHSTCRWPVGDPQSPDFYFCGGPAIEGLPYCACHHRIAYMPARRREAA